MTHLSLRLDLKSKPGVFAGLLITLTLLLSPLALALNMDAKDAYSQGQKAKKRSAWQSAERLFTEARKLEPTWTKPLEALIRLRIDGKLSKTPLAQELSDFRKLQPSSYKVWLFEARYAHQRGRHQEALQAYTKTLQIRPRTLSALINRGDLHLLLNNAELALQDYREVLNLRPKNREALWGKLLALVSLKDWKGAHELANILARDEPENIALWNLQNRASKESGLPPPPPRKQPSRVYRELPPSNDIASEQK